MKVRGQDVAPRREKILEANKAHIAVQQKIYDEIQDERDEVYEMLHDMEFMRDTA